MTQRLKFASFVLLAAGAAWFAPAAKADEWDKKTVLTFNEPVEVPGKVLPAGTYVFKLLDSESDRNVVQIFTEDERHLVTTIMAISDYREEPADKTVVTFSERPSGSPEALHSWFYPGETIGLEFVYPKTQQPLAAYDQPALMATTPAAAPKALPEPPAEHAPEDDTAERAMITEDEVVIAQAAPAPTADDGESADNGMPMPDTLPQTAGNFASIPLLGVALLAGGFTTIRFAKKQS